MSGSFYVDKTAFIRDWWHSKDVITLICRPRSFGKTLNLDTVHCLLSATFQDAAKSSLAGSRYQTAPPCGHRKQGHLRSCKRFNVINAHLVFS